MDVFFQHLFMQLLQSLLTVQGNCIQFLLVLVLFISAVLLGYSFPAFGQIGFLKVLQLAVVGEEPRNQVNIG